MKIIWTGTCVRWSAIGLWVALSLGAAGAADVAGPAGELLKKAQTQMGAGQLTEARATLGQAFAKAAPGADQITIASALAQVMAAEGKLDEAKEYLADLAKKSGNISYKLELARLIMRTDLAGLSDAVDHLKEVVTKEPKNLEAWLDYGRAQARNRDSSGAFKTFEHILRNLAPKELRAHYGMAEMYMIQSEFKKARTQLAEALKLDPENVQTHLWIGKAHERDTKLPGARALALSHYENANRLTKGSECAGAILFALINSEGHESSVGAARRLLKDPNDSVAVWHNGLRKELKAEVGPAQADYLQAVALDPTNCYARYSLVHSLMGEPSPGYPPIGGPRAERWRYLPQMNLGQAQGHLAALKLQDPTFPGLVQLEERLTEKVESMQRPAQAMTPDSEQRYKKMAEYYQFLQMSR